MIIIFAEHEHRGQETARTHICLTFDLLNVLLQAEKLKSF